ncbi:MAG TPA: TrbC/VirB2 family protein [Candidatus Peribacteraceae bacterium]|nr:TrbC/VirB2 family protein [Candidatus Peribacteraceae bacterium]
MNANLQRTARTLATAGILSFVYTSTAFAQFAGPSPTGLGLAASAGDPRQEILNIVAAVLNFLALIAVVVIIIAGIRLIVSQGEEEQKEKAKKTIFYAVAGLIIVLFARVIVELITVYLAQQVGATTSQ